MRISVALATHNSERYLVPLLESLATQTLLPCELVVGDDASEDATREVLDDFAGRAPFPVHVHRNASRRGHIPTFLDIAAKCRGDWIAFADHDDVWLNEKLEVCARRLTDSGAMLALHDMQVVDEGLRDLGRTWPGIRSTTVMPALHANALEFHAPGAAMVFRRSLLEVSDAGSRPQSRYLEGQPMGHDEWFFFLGNVCGPAALISTPLLLYRRHESNASGELPHERGLRVRPVIDTYRKMADLNDEYSRFLESAAAAADPASREALSDGAAQYRAAARRWKLRVAFYEAARRRKRMSLMWRLAKSGAYRGRHLGALGRAALPKDLVAGLVLGLRGT